MLGATSEEFVTSVSCGGFEKMEGLGYEIPRQILNVVVAEVVVNDLALESTRKLF